MRVLYRLFSFYINSSIHVAMAVCALTFITQVYCNLPLHLPLLCFVFFATVTGYNFVKYFGVAKFHHRSLTAGLKAIQVFSFLCFVLTVYFAFQFSLKTLLFLALLAIITFTYAIPFLPKRYFIDSDLNLRSIGGLKIYIIGVVWTAVTVFLPVVYNGSPLLPQVFVLGIQRFVLVIVLMLPFEIRDLKYDSLKLSTIPQQIGIRRTKVIGSVLIVGVMFLEFVNSLYNPKYGLVLALVLFLTILLLWCAKKNQHNYYSAFWVEGLPIFWLGLILGLT